MTCIMDQENPGEASPVDSGEEALRAAVERVGGTS